MENIKKSAAQTERVQLRPQGIKSCAEKELARMKKVFEKLEIKNNSKKSAEFYDFAKRYFEDGKYFYEKKKYIEAFEAEIIAWAYIDTGLKLGFFSVPKELKGNFTAKD